MTGRIVSTLAAVALVSGGLTVAGQAPPRTPPSSPELHVLPVRGNVFMLVGAGANITVSVGREGVLLVDSGGAATADAVVAAITRLARDVTAAPTTVKPCAGFGCAGVMYPSLLATIASPTPARPIQFIVNTNADPDHVGGNAVVAAAGTTFGGGPGLGAFAFVKESAMVYAHEDVLSRMTAAKVASAGLPTESYPTELKQYFNGEGVHLLHQPAAHSDGDTIVHFRGSDVISTGDILSTVSYPTFDIARGGSINGVIDGLNRLLDLVIAEYQTEGGTLLIPGHGRVCDAADLATYRDAITIIRDRVQDMIKRGKTVAEVKAARPTKDYDPRYDVPTWTRDQFVEAVYRSLAQKK
jgi:glyoxylase-like metal-dependent hydrolase (beta-lactamase superfamily II)